MKRKQSGFTLVEVMMIIAVLVILAGLVIVGYNTFVYRSAIVQTRQTLVDATKSLQVHYSFNQSYSPNFADMSYSPPLTVPLVLYTNAPQTPVYQDLSEDQNAQLFINSCNGFMPVVDGSTTYLTSCSYDGNNLHAKGKVASNVVIEGTVVEQSAFVLTCDGPCTTAQNDIIAKFLEQGGHFPIIVPKSSSILPVPTLRNSGPADRYCLEARYSKFTDIIYHTKPSATAPQEGPCPADPTLHYP